ncbi:MAG: hypothetical protein LBV01_00650 [Deltaproteobacteria bacterium]|jgi:flagellin|nr:hypothetical protein [Deltaproteobacteria bacterium]
MSDSLRLQTLALMGQEFLAQALASGGSLDSAVAEMLLSSRPSTGKEKSAAALTGRIRSDAALLRQGAKNASEGASMASSIAAAGLSLGEMLSDMQTLVQSVASGQLTIAAARPAYDSLVSALGAVVSGTQYNGISLLNKNGWAGDERLTVTGDTATLSLQLGQGSSTFSLRDLSFLAVDLSSSGASSLQSLLNTISRHLATVNSMTSGYEALAGAYTGEAKQLESQAGILTQAAARAVAGAGASLSEGGLGNILMDLALSDQGRLVDTSS